MSFLNNSLSAGYYQYQVSGVLVLSMTSGDLNLVEIETHLVQIILGHYADLIMSETDHGRKQGNVLKSSQ